MQYGTINSLIVDVSQLYLKRVRALSSTDFNSMVVACVYLCSSCTSFFHQCQKWVEDNGVTFWNLKLNLSTNPCKIYYSTWRSQIVRTSLLQLLCLCIPISLVALCRSKWRIKWRIIILLDSWAENWSLCTWDLLWMFGCLHRSIKWFRQVWGWKFHPAFWRSWLEVMMKYFFYVTKIYSLSEPIKTPLDAC